MADGASPSRWETAKPKPHIVSESGSTQWTRCISRRVLASSTSAPPFSSSRNCHDAKHAKSSTDDAKPVAGAIPRAWKKGASGLSPSRFKRA